MDTTDIEAYLEAFRTEGVFDSEGHFTLDKQRAIGKLAQYLLPDPGQWILKIVQGASRFRAVTMKVTELRAYSHIEIEMSTTLDHGLFRRGLLGESQESAGVEFISQALRCLSLTDKRAVTVTVSSPFTTSHFVMNNGEISETEVATKDEQLDHTRISILSPRPTSGSQDIFERGKDAALHFAERYLEMEKTAEFIQLYEKARASDVRLWLNGQRIDDLDIPWNYGDSSYFNYVGAVFAYAPKRESNTIIIPHGISRREKDYRHGLLPSNHGPLASLAFQPGEEAACLLALHDHVSESLPMVRSRMHYVKDGILVGSTRSGFHATMGFDLVLSPSDLRTDLTGLNARIPDAVAEKYERYLSQFRGTLRKLALYLSGTRLKINRSLRPVEFEGLELDSKLRLFAAGKLKARTRAGMRLESILKKQPFDIQDVAQRF